MTSTRWVTQPDRSSKPKSAARSPKLRSGLRIHPRQDRDGTRWFMVELPEEQAYHRLGLVEYEFLVALDGRRSVDEVRLLVASWHPHAPVLSPGQAESLLQFATRSGLLESPAISSDSRHAAKTSENRWRLVFATKSMNWQWLQPSLGSLFSKAGLISSLLAGVWIFMLVTGDWIRFEQDLRRVIQPQNLWTLALVWLTLKVVHELGHLAAAVRYQCKIGEVGFAWMLIAPVAFVDLTDMQRIGSRRQRIAIALGGVYFELLAGLIALGLWCIWVNDTMGNWLVSFATTAMLGSLLFNLNPLMKLDGYHAMCDLLNRPQLAMDSQVAMKQWLKRWLFGQKPAELIHKAQSKRTLLIYGFSCLAYRLALTCGLVTVALAWYGPTIALVLIGFLVAVWSMRLVQAIRMVHRVAQDRPAVWLRLAVVCGVLAVPSYAASRWWQTQHNQFYGIVEFADAAPIRAACDGNLIRRLVNNQQWVEKGTPLLELENLQLSASRRQLELDLKAGEIRRRQFQQRREFGKEAAERRANEAIAQRLEEARRQESALIVTAPRSGRVIFEQIDTLIGTWYREGDNLLRIVDPQRKRVFAATPPAIVPSLLPNTSLRINSTEWWSRTLTGQVEQLASQAANRLPHPALAASAGGPVSVQANTPDSEPQAVTPYVTAQIEVLDSQDQLRAGQTVRVSVGSLWY